MIKVALFFQDKEFEGKVSDAIATMHTEIVPVIGEEMSFDVAVTDSDEVAAAYAPAAVTVSAPFRVSELLARICDVYTEVAGRVPLLLRPGRNRSRTLLFCAAQGGCGCTAAAIGLCRELRRYRGHDVCYVSLEPFGGEERYFSGDGTRFFYFIARTGGMQPIPLPFFLCDEFGIKAVPTGNAGNELLFGEHDDFTRIVDLICGTGFDFVIFDAGTSVNKNTLALMQSVDNICIVEREFASGKENKLHTLLEGLSDDIERRTIAIRNFVHREEEQEDCDMQCKDRVLLEYDPCIAEGDIDIDGAFGLGIKEIASLLELHNNSVVNESFFMVK